MTCSVVGCDKPALWRGLCRLHYYRDYRSDPRRAKKLKAQQAAWFQAKKRQETPAEMECVSPEARLRQARVCYQQAIGIDQRIRWQRIIKELEAICES